MKYPIGCNMQNWQAEDAKALEIVKSLQIPNGTLDGVPFVELKSIADFNAIPKSGGAYWIVTNEKVTHSLNGTSPTITENGLTVVYNGVSQSGLNGRAKEHLLRKTDLTGGHSGISVDLYVGDNKPTSHTKVAFGVGKKLPSIGGRKVTSKKDLLQLGCLSTAERAIVLSDEPTIWFQNGIDVEAEKHQPHSWRFYFIAGLKSSLYIDHLERGWREMYGSPPLCSYTSGR